MGSSTTVPDVSPDRTDVIPESYALYVDDRHVHVWQYRHTLAARDGEWYYEETLELADGVRLSLEYATPTPPSGDGYWVYSRSYACELDCNER
jgi:hypothetical protein